MTSEIRANTLKNRVGLGTVSLTNTGIVVSGIVTANSFSGTGDLDIAGVTTTSTLHVAANNTTVGVAITQSGTGDILKLYDGTAEVFTVANQDDGVGAVTISSPKPRIVFNETNASPDYEIRMNGGIFSIHDATNGIGRISITSSRTDINNPVLINNDILYIGDKLVHWTDDDTAIRFPSANTISMETGGTERIRIGSNGDIYIRKAETGASKGSAALEFYGTTSGSLDRDQAKIESSPHTSNTNAGNLDFYTQTVIGNNLSLRMRIDGEGNIGAGIAPSSGARLWIATNDNPFVGTRYNAGADGSVLFLQHSRSNTIGTNVALNDNDEIGAIQFRAYASNNSSIKMAALIKAEVNGTTGADGVPTDLIFATGTNSSNATEKLRIATNGVITAQKSGVFGNTSDSFTALTITSSTSGISELRFGDTTANAGYVKYEHSSNNLIFASNATPRMTVQSTGIVKVETSDSSGLNAHMLVNNSESSAGISLLGSGSSFSSGGWAAVTDAGIIRSSANASNGLVLQAASGDLRFYAGGNPPAERFRIANNGTPSFYSPAEAWHEGPAVLEASNGYGAIFFRSTGSTHGTSTTGTWSIGKLNASNGFAILKNGMTGSGAVRGDAPLSISNAGDITIGKYLKTPKRPAFFVTMNGGDQTTTATNRLPFDTVVHNEGGNYKTSGSDIYNFVCPVAGYYFFGAQVWLKHGSGTGNHARWEIWRDTTVVALAGWHQNGVNLQDMQSSATVTIYCDAGAKVYVEADYNLTYWRGNASQPHTFFHGFLIG